jgi:UDP-GlcNAc:undecaprenyl-phosphate GlcNAc-1-phosphate transferase
MSLTSYVLLTALLIGIKVAYFRIARHFGLFDTPNERSSHTGLITIRAGGIIFYLAVLAAVSVNKLNQPYFFAGLTMVALISFWDDIYAVSIRYRIVAQFIAMSLLLLQTGLFPDQKWALIGLLIIGVGSLNAYNFMDGINGMTAFYSLVTVGTLWYQQSQVMPIDVADSLFPFVIIALLIFSYFNARRQAICFAGDVGSISIGFISLHALLTAINQSHTYLLVLFLAVYGVDSVLTIIHRLYLGQSIFQAHRLHLFQLIVHQYGWPHLRVSAMYALVQAGINVLVLRALNWSLIAQIILTGLILGVLVCLYISLKKRLMNYSCIEKGRFS